MKKVIFEKSILSCVLIFLICCIARVVEYFGIRTDETILAENFIHKVFGIIILVVMLVLSKLSWDSIGFTKTKIVQNVLKGLALGVSCFSIAYLVECVLLYCMNGNVQLSVYTSGFSLNGEAVKQIVKETIGVGVNEKAVLRFDKTALSFTSISIFPW